jgi:hypothetical protein
MKKSLIALTLIFAFSMMKAQYYTFFTFGYNAGLSGSQKTVNHFVNDYNNSRPWLDQKMNKQDYVQGITLSWGLGSDNIFFDLMYSNKYSAHTALGTPSSGTLVRRDVRFTFNTASFALYFINPDKKNFRGPGISLDIGKIRQKTRTGDPGNIESQKYSDIGISSSIGATLCYNYKLKIVRGVFLGFRPYIQYLKSQADIYVMSKSVNNLVYSGRLDGLNYGLQLNLAFGTYHYSY